jgi:CubicO group peptidase (beta-lactamase class C family)
MTARWIGLLFAMLLAAACGSGGSSGNVAPTPTPEPTRAPGTVGDGELGANLEDIRKRHSLPALAGMSFDTTRVLERGVSGVRAAGFPEAATVDDRWHIGSITKSMTATLAAVLVERGRIRWDTTIPEALPSVTVRPEFEDVRLEELFTHTSGMPPDSASVPSLNPLVGQPASREARLQLAAEVLALPGTARGAFNYSNAGYVVAGAMLEEAGNALWEDQMFRRVFEPLGMSDMGFGAPGTAGRRDQPWGHAAGNTPVEPGPNADNPAAVGPAGTVHATMGDLARYFQLHLNGARGEAALVGPASFDTLHQPAPGTVYGCGWVVENRSWANGRTLSHGGSNTLWYAVVWLAPARGFGVFAVTNVGGTAAAQATDDAATVLIQRYLVANP